MSMPHGGSSWNSQVVVVGRRALFKAAFVANRGAAPFWMWVCDSATTGATAPTCVPVYVPSLTTQSLFMADVPRQMVNGIYVCATTDPEVKTLIAANDAFFEVAYEDN